MSSVTSPRRLARRIILGGASVALLAAAIVANVAAWGIPRDDDRHDHFIPGNLVVSRSVYDDRAANVKLGAILPPGCASKISGSCGGSTGAPVDGTYPFVWNNDGYDSSFGITSRIFLDQITPFGWNIDTLEVPNSLQHGIGADSDQLVTSFSSKSEMALNLSLDRKHLTFSGYVAPVNTLDASNSDTPGALDNTNPVGVQFYRAEAVVDRDGRTHFSETNAYSGNNGRAAILNDLSLTPFFYTAGNAGNGANPQPGGVVLGAGAQFIEALREHEAKQTPGTPAPVGSFSVTELGQKADKVGKDDNFRGMTVFNNVVYYTKGSGSNGVDTVYFVDATGAACPGGIGLPSASAELPTGPIAGFSATTGTPENMCILKGFPTPLAKSTSPAPTNFPFGLWFADANTLYVADEGNGTLGPSSELGAHYTVKGYPTGNNSGPGGTGLPWAPATDGLRNLTGRVNPDGTVTVWAITSTVSGNGDQGADPNRLVVITDRISITTPAEAANEKFYTLRTANFGEVLRGVSFTPGTGIADRDRDRDRDRFCDWLFGFHF